MIRFLHAADIHLDSPLRGLEGYDDAPVVEIRGAVRRAFDNLVDLAVEEEVDFVLLAGDLYDGDWKDYNTGLFFVERMGRLNRQGIRVFMVSGNHDAASRITKSLQLPDNVTMLSSKKAVSLYLDDLGVVIHGRSYPARAVTENLVHDFPQQDPAYFNIGLLHTGLTGREGHEAYAPCSQDDLVGKGYGYWALGHVHRREEVCIDPWIVFSGNIQGRHIRETGAKGALLVTVENGRVSEVSFRELDVLRWVLARIDVADCEELETVLSRVRQRLEEEQDQAHGRMLALRLEFTGDSPLHSRLLEKAAELSEEFRAVAAGLGSMWLEKILIKTRRRISLEEVLGRDNPLASLLTGVQQLECDTDTLLEIAPEITALFNKLPPPLLADDDPLLPTSPEEFGQFLDQVKELLIAKLIRHNYQL